MIWLETSHLLLGLAGKEGSGSDRSGLVGVAETRPARAAVRTEAMRMIAMGMASARRRRRVSSLTLGQKVDCALWGCDLAGSQSVPRTSYTRAPGCPALTWSCYCCEELLREIAPS